MTTFLEIVKANGFESIEAYLEAISDLPVPNDIPESVLRKIRQNETLTEEYLRRKS